MTREVERQKAAAGQYPGLSKERERILDAEEVAIIQEEKIRKIQENTLKKALEKIRKMEENTLEKELEKQMTYRPDGEALERIADQVVCSQQARVRQENIITQARTNQTTMKAPDSGDGTTSFDESATTSDKLPRNNGPLSAGSATWPGPVMTSPTKPPSIGLTLSNGMTTSMSVHDVSPYGMDSDCFFGWS